jgi:5'-nucleotidase
LYIPHFRWRWWTILRSPAPVHAGRIVLLIALTLGGCAAPPPQTGPLHLRLIAFNDFHGNLETPSGTIDVPDPRNAGRSMRTQAGGVEYMAALVAQLRAGHSPSMVVAAGDLIGASPAISSFLRDEPSIAAMDALGLEVSSVGNHEFDRGPAELMRLQSGGCVPGAACTDSERFPGARFRYLAANVIDEATGKPLFPPYLIRRFEGIPVAFIGVVLRGTPGIVTPAGTAGLRFRDEAEAVNELVPELKRQGVEALVVLIHQGGETAGSYDDPACPGFSGPIIDIVRRLDPAVDLVVSGHTHQAYVCRVGSRPVTQAGSYGRFVTAIDLDIDRASRDVTGVVAHNHLVDPAVLGKDSAETGIVARARAATLRVAARPVGRLAGPLLRERNRAGESPLGDVVADSQLQAMAAPAAGGAQFAWMNAGGIRADLAPRGESVTYGEAFAVLPFGNSLVVLELSGAQIGQALERQWNANGEARIMQVSGNFHYDWDGTRPSGRRVVPGSITLDGRPIDRDARYRVVVNNFMADGGDGLIARADAKRLMEGPSAIDAFADYLGAHAGLAPPRAPRIGRVDP